MADLIIPKIWEGKEICICVTEERAVFVYDKEQDKFIDTGETAIELPPHGRLKDESVIIQKVEDAFCKLFFIDGTYIKPVSVSDCHKAFLKAVFDAPTIVEASTEELTDEQIYELQNSERDYCEMYEPTYNPEDGSM